MLVALAAASGPAGAQEPSQDFPKFIVPGLEKPMASLEALHRLHYARARPLATLWDEWMVGPSLWPGTPRHEQLCNQWRGALLSRRIDPEGYVATHQHASIAHQDGWPFPFWMQGGLEAGAWGWHFSLKGVPKGWHSTEQRDQAGWTLIGGRDGGIDEDGWNLALEQGRATVETPPLRIEPAQSPFLQLRWRAEGLGNAQPYVEWCTTGHDDYGPERRFYFAPPSRPDAFSSTMIPVHRCPTWAGTITRLRVQFDNPPGAEVTLQAMFTQYDTRHNINNQAFIIGCDQYARWTRDLNFLRDNINRMRLALLYVAREMGGREHNCVVTPFVGHDGRSALVFDEKGNKQVIPGRGIGNNYWDLLPFGLKDTYATIRYYHALNVLADIEEQIAEHPEWNIPGGPLRQEPDALRAHAAEVKKHAGSLFWNEKTGRFVSGIDADGVSHDYGFTFLNCEAIYYGFATEAQAQAIMAWLSGKRIVEGDTSRGDDIYHWRFAPRATTKRNVEYYGFFWPFPENIPWGGQVQDGGAVLGFSYHDLMARLAVRGPDDAWSRLREILAWFDEVQAAGGYRAYYADGKRGTLQGGGTAGGLGLDAEFFESLLVPQVMLDGFLGFKPQWDGFEVNPRLPQDWPTLTVTRIALHDGLLNVTASHESFTVEPLTTWAEPVMIDLPAGRWRVEQVDEAGNVHDTHPVTIGQLGQGVSVRLEAGTRVRFVALADDRQQ